MTRQVNADVVLAALRHALAELSEPTSRGPMMTLKVATAKVRLENIVERIEQQATERADPSKLEGATVMPMEGTRAANIGEFAASWNAADPIQRHWWWTGRVETMERATRCVLQNHDGLQHELDYARGMAWRGWEWSHPIEQRHGWVLEP